MWFFVCFYLVNSCLWALGGRFPLFFLIPSLFFQAHFMKQNKFWSNDSIVYLQNIVTFVQGIININDANIKYLIKKSPREILSWYLTLHHWKHICLPSYPNSNEQETKKAIAIVKSKSENIELFYPTYST